jgi:hypothetical protein
VIKLGNKIHEEGYMSVHDDIQKIEGHLVDVENYIEKGLWTPEENKQCDRKLADIDATLDKLNIASTEDYVDISKLIKRFVHAKNKLPSPP